MIDCLWLGFWLADGWGVLLLVVGLLVVDLLPGLLLVLRDWLFGVDLLVLLREVDVEPEDGPPLDPQYSMIGPTKGTCSTPTIVLLRVALEKRDILSWLWELALVLTL